MPHRLPMTKCTPLRILPGQSHREPINQQTAKCEHLRTTPVHPHLTVDHLHAVIELAHQFAISVKSLGHRRRLLGNINQLLSMHRGFCRAICARLPKSLPRASKCWLTRFCLLIFRIDKCRLELLAHTLLHRIDIIFCCDILLNQTPRIQIDNRWMLGDFSRLQGLCKSGIVGFIVTVSAITPQIDNHIVFHRLAISHSHACRVYHSFGIIGIDVENGHLNNLRHICWIRCKTRLPGQCGKTNLIIHNNVNRTPIIIAIQMGQANRLRHNALPGKSGIAVNDQRYDMLVLNIAFCLLLRTNNALNHGIDQFEVTRIRRQSQMHRVPIARDILMGEPHVVFYIARPLSQFNTLKLAEYLRIGLLHNMREHIEPAAMRHPHHHFFDI